MSDAATPQLSKVSRRRRMRSVTYTERRTLRECASSSSGKTCMCRRSDGSLHSVRPPMTLLGVGVVGAPWG